MNLCSLNLRSLDVLRGICAVYVLAGHARWLLWIGYSEWAKSSPELWEIPVAYASILLRFGHEAVLVFFALSGFFIHLRSAQGIAAGHEIRINVKKYFTRRAHRLVAPYALALLLTLALDNAGCRLFPKLYSAQTADLLINNTFGIHGFSFGAVVPALLMLPGSLGRDFGSNGPLWSLSYEVVYYAAYPLWLMLRRKSLWICYFVLPILGIGVGFCQFNNFAASVFSHYPIWLAGAALAEVLVNKRGRSKVGWRGALALSTVGFASCAMSMPPGWRQLSAIVFAPATVAFFTILPLSMSTNPVWRAVEFLGMRSYTIYIMHFPILVFISAWVFECAGRRPMTGWLALIGASVSLCICLLAFHLVEQRFLHKRLVTRDV